MIKFRKDRNGEWYSIDVEKPMMVYRNLNQKCWSMKQHGVVVAHADSLTLTQVKTKVSESGRKRVIAESRKNVHAYVIGFLSYDDVVMENELYYNPYLHESFVDKESKKEVGECCYAKFTTDMKVYYK